MDTNSFATDNPVLAAILSRRSVRRFACGADGKPLPIPEATLEAVLRAGMAAPSAKDSRPWDFVLVQDRGLLESLGARLRNAAMTATAGAAVIVCAAPSRMKDNCAPGLWLQDCAAAVENILLAAESSRIGAVWAALHPYVDRMTAVREILGIPACEPMMRDGAIAVEGIVPFALIPMGLPEGEWNPKDKWRPDRIHRERW